jgi:hypothetical protein
MTDDKAENKELTTEQQELLDLYLQKLDTVYEGLQLSEKLQVEIETEHLKKILSK